MRRAPSLPAGIVWWPCSASNSDSQYGNLSVDAVFAILNISILTFAIFRFGLLVTTVTLLVDNIPTAIPFVAYPGWASAPGYLALGLVAALGCFGFYAARAGQPVFRPSTTRRGAHLLRGLLLCVGVALQGSSGHGCFG